jgi:energy-coupling factor transport system permease protein
MVLLIFVRDLATPASFLALAYVVILVGARLNGPTAALLFLGVPLGMLVIGLGFSLWVDAARVDDTAAVLRIGGWTLFSGALETGFATALRLGAILGLALIGGLTTTGPDLVRASVQQLRVPYRIGYTAIAAFRFVPRFGHELAVIRAAHRVRGHHGGRGPFARIARGWGYIAPCGTGRARDGLPCLRRPPHAHRTPSRPVPHQGHRVHRAVARSIRDDVRGAGPLAMNGAWRTAPCAYEGAPPP